MNKLASSIRDWAAEVIGAWDRFWFTPTDPATLGLIRILAGAMLFYTHLVWSLRLEDFFTEHGWLSPQAIELLQRDSYAWSYFWLIDSPTVLWIVHVAALIVFAMLTLGLFTRVTSILAFLAAASYIGRVPAALFGLDQINLMLAMYLMVGPSGAAFSLDRWWRQRRAGQRLPAVEPSVGANIAIRLMQVHMCIIYLFAGMAKLSGQAWWDGTAMWLAIGNFEYQSIDITWLANWPRLIDFMTHLTIFWELSYCALVWPRLTRPIVLALAVPLHMGIALFLGMMTFGLVMLIGNLAFVPPYVIRAIISRRGAGQGSKSEAASKPKMIVREAHPRSSQTRHG